MYDPMESVWNIIAEWSHATFGDPVKRGPDGPLKHLAKEAAECLADPTDLTEYADCLILVFDACRRAGFSYRELVVAARLKMSVNRKRKWPAPTRDQPVEHIRYESSFGCKMGSPNDPNDRELVEG